MYLLFALNAVVCKSANFQLRLSTDTNFDQLLIPIMFVEKFFESE